MKIKPTSIEGVLQIEVEKFSDNRGYFMESWNNKRFGLPAFVQDNHTFSVKGVLRGLHYQYPDNTQGKLVRCTNGSVYDVIVDLRENSHSFGKWLSFELDRPELELWIPPGIAHGFYTCSETSEFQYKVTEHYDPNSEKVLLWNDKDVGIVWPFNDSPIMSERDLKNAKTFKESDKFS